MKKRVKKIRPGRSEQHSAFEIAVWSAAKKIPRGKVATYSQIARMIGSPGAVRAVGNALRKNPFAPKVPCHRVVRSDGKAGGFGGKKNDAAKGKLLKAEGVKIMGGKIDLQRHCLQQA
jgi:methylated-DNA-[protein]-cysteine S-methyltransferase